MIHLIASGGRRLPETETYEKCSNIRPESRSSFVLCFALLSDTSDKRAMSVGSCARGRCCVQREESRRREPEVEGTSFNRISSMLPQATSEVAYFETTYRDPHRRQDSHRLGDCAVMVKALLSSDWGPNWPTRLPFARLPFGRLSLLTLNLSGIATITN